MNSKLLVLVASVVALATSGPAAADGGGGNTATGALGTVQANSVTVAPVANVTTAATNVVADTTPAQADVGGPAAAVAPAANSAQSSAGTVQIGGGTATSSVATAQVGTVATRPEAGASAAGQSVKVIAANGTASGGNTASRALGTVQAGAVRTADVARVETNPGSTDSAAASASVGDSAVPNGAEGSVGSIQVGGRRLVRSEGGGSSAARLDGVVWGSATGDLLGSLQRVLSLTIDDDRDQLLASNGETRSELLSVLPALALGLVLPELALPVAVFLGDVFTASADPGSSASRIAADLHAATVRAPAFALSPQVTAASPLLGTSVTLGGANVLRPDDSTAADTLATAQAGGVNSASASTGTLQVGAIDAGPTLAAHAEPAGTSIAVGGAAGLGGDNAVSGSLGTIQAGGGSSAVDSLLTAQFGDLVTAPTVGAFVAPAGVRIAELSLGGSHSVGGGNEAAGGIGTMQVGSGNSATGSPGTVQASGASLGPAVTASLVPGTGLATGLDTGGGIALAGGPNRATDSPGTVQIGGGNTANGSPGTVQASALEAAPTLTTRLPFGTTVALGGASTLGGGGNNATDSVGTLQLGGGNTASESVGATQAGDLEAAPGVTLRNGVTHETVALGGATEVGSGNVADNTLGTVQTGGGNTARDSVGTVQGGEVAVAPALGIPSRSGTGSPIVGPGGPNVGLDSPAAAAAGRPLAGARPAAGAASLTPVARPVAAPAATTATPVAPGRNAAPASNVKGATANPAVSTQLAQAKPSVSRTLFGIGAQPRPSLPVTGFDPWLFMLLGLALVAAGATIRRTATPAVWTP